MAFAAQLHRSLDHLDRRFSGRLGQSDALEDVLDEYLHEVEAASDRPILTSILLLDASGEHLLHGAAPSLPDVYCQAAMKPPTPTRGSNEPLDCENPTRPTCSQRRSNMLGRTFLRESDLFRRADDRANFQAESAQRSTDPTDSREGFRHS